MPGLPNRDAIANLEVCRSDCAATQDHKILPRMGVRILAPVLIAQSVAGRRYVPGWSFRDPANARISGQYVQITRLALSSDLEINARQRQKMLVICSIIPVAIEPQLRLIVR